MAQLIIDLLLTLIQNMSVIIVLAYVLTRTTFFNEILERRLTPRNRAYLTIFFGGFSIYGTLSGMNILGAIANIRDLGPALAGLLGGPWVGFGAGLIGAAHRWSLGGFTALSCSLSTLIAGLAGGLVFVVKRGRFINVREAIVLATAIEVVHMYMGLILSRPYEQILAIVTDLFLPMLLANGLGMGIFAFIVHNVVEERRLEARQAMMNSDLRIARNIQSSMVPKSAPALPPGLDLDLHAELRPAREVGGDLYDFFFLDDGRFCFTIGDVSGKGVPAALFMSIAMFAIKAKMKRGLSPAEICFQANNDLCDRNDSLMFATVFVGLLDPRTGEVRYCNAGHNPPYRIGRDGQVAPLALAGGIAFGVIPDTLYREDRLVLSPDDALFLYTDGVTEAMDPRNRLFSETRLEQTLREKGHLTMTALCGEVLDKVQEFAGHAPQSDDIAVLGLRYRSPETRS